MASPYPPIPNTRPISHTLAAPIPATQPLPSVLTSPGLPTPGAKCIFAFWLTGIQTLPAYLLRNVIAWHRRYSPLGWTIYVVDTVDGSPLHISRFLDVSSAANFPAAFAKALAGPWRAQHTSDLVRFPLLLRYGGVYLDVGVLQYLDLDRLWRDVIANPADPRDFAGFTMGRAPELSIVNFTLVATPENPLLRRAHRILLKLWEGREGTEGMHAHPLVAGGSALAIPQEGKFGEEELAQMSRDDAAMTDYAIQIQALWTAQRWVDPSDGWDGPGYTREKAWLLSFLDGASVPMELTGWNGRRNWELLRLPVAREGESESEEQRLARRIVEESVGRSVSIKLGHESLAGLMGGDTLGMLWRKNPGSDCEEGTYAGWLRWAELNCEQVIPVQPMEIPVFEPTRVDRLDDFV